MKLWRRKMRQTNSDLNLDIEKTLEERGENYGNYGEGAHRRAKIMTVCKEAYLERHQNSMPGHIQVMFLDLINKLHRLASSPDHQDSAHDIQGYAKLIEEEIINENIWKLG